MFFGKKEKELHIPQIDINNLEVTREIITDEYIFTDNVNDKSTNTEEPTNIENDNHVPMEFTINNTRESDNEEEDEELEEDNENTIYVICIDDKPSFYEKNSSAAESRINKMARLYNLNDIGYHTTLTNYKNEREIEILRNFDCGFFSLTFTMHTLKIYRIEN